VSKTIVAMIASVALVFGALWFLSKNETPRRPTRPDMPSGSAGEILVFCAAANQAVLEEIRKEYEAETGRRVSIQYGSSQTLLSQIDIAKTGDLYLPADTSFLTIARDKALIDEVIDIASMRCGVAVAKGNPKGIKSLRDLMNDNVRLVQANADSAAVAKKTREVLTPKGLWEELEKATDSHRTTITDVANDVKVGAADAGIVYDAVLHSYPDLEFVEIAELADAVSHTAVAVLSSSKSPSDSLHFARYIAASDRGLKRYKEHGFTVADGDVWKDVPELSVYAGSMLRPAIEETIVAFERREGVRVSRVYNGCGILVSQMKSGQHPDAYFACDVEFMSQVKDLFPKSIDVSQNELVILVPKGNPKNIQSLLDLTREKLRVGIGHEKQCAMGWITQKTFKESGIQTELMSNVTVQTPTGDMLVNQLRAGSLDAAVAYLSNAAGAADFLDAIEIVGLECSTAIQPWAVAPSSKNAKLADRLFQKITSVESQNVFTSEGFQWKLGQPKMSVLPEATN
jgi:molybdenum ABC transporter molybdate-binding protein